MNTRTNYLLIIMLIVFITHLLVAYAHHNDDGVDKTKYYDNQDYCRIDDDCIDGCGTAVNKYYLEKNPPEKLRICPTVVTFGAQCERHSCKAIYDEQNN